MNEYVVVLQTDSSFGFAHVRARNAEAAEQHVRVYLGEGPIQIMGIKVQAIVPVAVIRAVLDSTPIGESTSAPK